LRFNKLLTIHLIWICALLAPIQTVAQEKDSAGIHIVVPADTVLPGQKKPFTESQRLEASNKRYLKRAFIPSAILIGTGIAFIPENNIFSRFDVHAARDKVLPNFATEADDFLMLAPLAGLYGFNIISSQNRHELGRQTLLLAASGALASVMVWPTKKLTNIERPNKEPYAFPSGHTAYAFTIATFMDKEFRHKSPWISVVSYSLAGATGVLRVLNDAHWMSDVLAGAGVGILSVNTVYWIHAKLTEGGGLNTAVVPVVLPNGNPGVGMYVQF
jgi:membrane-associated phospholipid phosphatase